MDYVLSLGYRDDEIARLGADALSWRGAVYRAVPIPPQLGDSAADGSPRITGHPPLRRRHEGRNSSGTYTSPRQRSSSQASSASRMGVRSGVGKERGWIATPLERC